MTATIDPHREDIERLKREVPPGVPLVMLNLLRFRAQAQYPPGDPSAACRGRTAYMRYSAVAIEKVKQVGGEPLWIFDVLSTFIGPTGEKWDEVLIVRYPSVEAFLGMLAMPDYRAATVHRTAALENSRLVVMRAPPSA